MPTPEPQSPELSLALKGAKSGIWDWHIPEELVFFGPNYYRIAGYEPDEFPSNFEEWEKRVHPDDIAAIKKEIQQYIAGELDHFTVEFRFKTKSGSWMWILGQGEITEWDEAGNPKRFIGLHIDISQSKITEQSYQQERAFNTSLVDTAQMIILLLDTEGRISRINPYMETITGYKEAEVKGKDWFDTFLPAANHTEIRAMFKKAIVDIDVSGEANLIVTKDGRELMIEWYNKTLKGIDGAIIGLLSFGIDIAERIQAEQELKKSEYRFKNLSSLTFEGIIIHNKGIVKDTNSSLAKMFGYTQHEMIGKNGVELLITNESRSTVYENINKNVATPYEVMGIKKCGTHFPVEIHSRDIITDTDNFRVTAIRDITVRKQAEKKLQDSELKFKLFVDNTQDWESWTDPEGNYIYVSPSCERITGYTPHDFSTNPKLFFDLIQPEYTEIVQQHFSDKHKHKHKQQAPTHSLVFPIVTKAGEERWIDHHCSPVYDEQGHYVGRRGSNRDISARKKAESALSRSEAKLTSVLRSAPVGIGQVANRVFIFVNDQFATMLGYTKDELIGEKSRIVYHNDEEFEKVGEYKYQQIQKEGTGSIETIMRKKDGTSIDVFLSSTPVNQEDLSQGVTFSALDITERKHADNIIHKMAYYDSLTGLPNRLLFLNRLEQSMKVSERKGKQIAVLLIDLDRFKNINDSLGHHVGDELLIYVARLIESCVRDMDTVARLSGDEFAIIVEDPERCEKISIVAQRILDAFLAPIMLSEHQTYSSCSIGITVYPQDATEGEVLLKNADIAMYEAKSKGSGRYHFYAKEMDGIALRRHELENGIHCALINDEFFLCYQPQVNLETGKITCLEALIRWQDPIKGLVSPGEFIPLAEETALILMIDNWVLHQACRQCRTWLDSGYSEIKVAINVSGLQFKQPDFVELIDKVLLESGLPADCLELELTEGHLMDNIETTINTLMKLKDRGVSLAIDDFGTGYSSLSYLKNFPIDRVKIDQSFVRSLPGDDSDIAIIGAIVALAQSLDMKVIAEGVETLEQLEILKNKNCLEVQGYFFSRPCRFDDLKQLLDEPAPFHEYI